MGVFSFTLMRPSALLCASLVVVTILFPEEATAGKKGVAPVKHLFGVGLGYQKVVQYKPVLVISKGRHPKPRTPGWGWGGGNKGGYSPLVIEQHVHKLGKSGYPHHSPSHHHRRKRKRPPHRPHHHPHHGGRGWGGWRQGWRRPHRSFKKGHGGGSGWRHYEGHSHHHHKGSEGYHHHPPHHHHPEIEHVDHPPHHEPPDYHSHHEIAEDPPHHHGVADHPPHHEISEHPHHHSVVDHPPHHPIADHHPRHPIVDHLAHHRIHEHNHIPRGIEEYPGVTVYGSTRVASHPAYPASPSSSYFGQPFPAADEVEEDNGGYETEIHESWKQDAETTANTPTSSSTSSTPPNFPFSDFTKKDASVTTMHRDFMKNHMQNYRQFQEYTQATTLQPREDSVKGKQYAPFMLRPPGPYFSTMDPQSSSEVQYDDDYNESQNDDDYTRNNNGIEKKMMKSQSKNGQKSTFPSQAPTTPTMQTSASTYNQVITAMPTDNSFKPSPRIDEVGNENSFSQPGFFPTFQQFQQIQIT